ncbi:MAG TPA: hypothetical protein VKU02_09500 [Gemmataceae bacterium]|nr:hypothetical protein [Gemmataceae bacterium]
MERRIQGVRAIKIVRDQPIERILIQSGQFAIGESGSVNLLVRPPNGVKSATAPFVVANNQSAGRGHPFIPMRRLYYRSYLSLEICPKLRNLPQSGSKESPPKEHIARR